MFWAHDSRTFFVWSCDDSGVDDDVFQAEQIVYAQLCVFSYHEAVRKKARASKARNGDVRGRQAAAASSERAEQHDKTSAGAGASGAKTLSLL